MIYFIRSYNKFIKIGVSTEPIDRLKVLQTGNPTGLHLQATMLGEFQTEKGLHEMFSHLRAKGEWFRYTDELKWFIKTVKKNPGQTNIKSLYMESQKLRLSAKAKRLGPNHKLSKKINEV